MSELPDLRSLSFAELLDLHLQPELTQARGLIETAADLLRRIDGGEVPTPALAAVTGPLADALLLLARYGARECPGLDLPGLTEPTGCGALVVEGPDAAR